MIRATERGSCGFAWTLLAGVCGLGLMASTAPPAVAQAGPQAAGNVEEIIVTGSRIERSGITAPTPTTTLGVRDFETRGLTNVGQIIAAIPAFQGVNTPASTALTSARAGGSYLNLRGLGDNRTLVLVDGRRFVSTNPEASVDVKVIPSALIGRVDVVTGGASAAYGSDAVAGVVNIVLRQELDGFVGDVQGGISNEGDNGTYKGSLAWGTPLGNGRGNLILSAEGERNKGVGLQTEREWASRGYALITNPAGGTPRQLIVPDAQFRIQTLGGLIVSGVLAGTDFGPGGVPRQFVSGPSDGFFQVGGNGVRGADYVSLAVPYDRYSFFGKGDYDLGPATIFAEASYSRSEGRANVLPTSNFGSLIIQRDNAFLPAALRTRMEAAGQTSFAMARFTTDFGLLTSNVENETTRGVLGLRGDVGENWKWDTYFAYGRTDNTTARGNNAINARYARARDAVIGPTGQPTCRVNVPVVTDAACVPVNLFGQGSPSSAALDYFLGTSVLNTELSQTVWSGSVTGDLFQLAGRAVAIAVGAEYREETVDAVADPISQADGFVFGNPKSLKGDQEIKEAFGEVLIPLLSDLPLANSLDVDGAVRFTDYSGAGNVTTWKVGLNWQALPDVRIRATRSRDVRAPNLSEMFSTSNTLFASIRDPQSGQSVTVEQITRGNPSLGPEEADTVTAGVVLTPSFVPGLQAAVDFYDIEIDGAVAVLGAQDLANRCAAGNTALCAFLTRDATGRLTRITRTQVNVAQIETSGIDFDLGYTFDLADLGVASSANVTVRGLATYVDKLATTNGGISIDRAGEAGGNNNGLPHWRYNLSLTYQDGPLTLFLENRYVGGGKYDNTLGPAQINFTDVASASYLNAAAAYAIIDEGDARLELFFNVNNLLDKDPPLAPSSFFAAPQTNAVLYDTIGRMFYAGLRFQY